MFLQSFIFKRPFEFSILTAIILILVLKFSSWVIALVLALALILAFLLYFISLRCTTAKAPVNPSVKPVQSTQLENFKPFKSEVQPLLNLGSEKFQAELQQIKTFLN